MKGTGKKGSGKSGGHKDCWENGEGHRQSVGGESLASRRKMPTADEVEDTLNQRRMEKSEQCGSVSMWSNGRKRKKALAAWGAGPSAGHMKIYAMNYVKFVEDDATGSVKFVKIDVMGSVKFVKIVMTGSSRVRSERRANVWRRAMERPM